MDTRRERPIEIIDLTYNIEEGMITFNAPWHTPVSVIPLGRYEVEGRETRKVILGTHTGTHVDAPLHFIKNGMSIEKIALKKMMGDVAIVDFSNLGDNGVVTREMLSCLTIKKRILFKFGWGKYWNTKKFYKNYPFFSRDAAEYLVFRKVELVGMDTPSPDDSRIILKDAQGSDKDSPIHKFFLKKNIILVEYIANLDKIKDYVGWNIVILPLKIKGADGAPARVCVYRGA